MRHPEQLIAYLVSKYAATMDADDPEATVTEMIIVDVIMHIREVSAPHARRALNDMLSDQSE